MLNAEENGKSHIKVEKVPSLKKIGRHVGKRMHIKVFLHDELKSQVWNTVLVIKLYNFSYNFDKTLEVGSKLSEEVLFFKHT